MDIGNGTIKHECNSIDDDSDPDCIMVQIPEDLLVHTTRNKIEAFVQFTYQDFKTNFQKPEYLKDREIQAMTNEIVDEINEHMLNLIPSTKKEYFSADTRYIQ